MKINYETFGVIFDFLKKYHNFNPTFMTCDFNIAYIKALFLYFPI